MDTPDPKNDGGKPDFLRLAGEQAGPLVDPREQERRRQTKLVLRVAAQALKDAEEAQESDARGRRLGSAEAAGQARDWLRIEGLPQSLKAPDWRAGLASTSSFRLAFDIPGNAAPGKYQAELALTAEGFERQQVPVALEVVKLEGLVVGVVRSDNVPPASCWQPPRWRRYNMNWPEYTNEHVYTLFKGWAGEEKLTVIGLRRDDARLQDKAYLHRVHLLFYGSIRDVPQKIDRLAEALKDYVKDGGWLVGDGYGFAWGMMDIRPELRDLTGLKWAHPNSNDVFSNATALRVKAKHPLSEGLEAGKDVPMGFANYGGTVYRLLPVLADLAIPIVLRDSEREYPYVAIREFGKGRCIMFSPLMGVFTVEYKTAPAQTILRNLIRWRKAE